MLNIFKKTKPWMVASLLVATSAFAQDNAQNTQKCKPQPQKCGISCDDQYPQLVAAYNAPARIDVRSCWDFYATGSFLYWQPLQDNMEVAVSSSTSGALDTASPVVPGSFVNMSTDYKPGFKVGLGMNFDYDMWDTYAEYTWFHGTQSTNATATSPGTLTGLRIPEIILVDNGGNTWNSLNQNWKLKMDFADLSLGRAYWVGSRLTFRPFVGARGAWIRQKISQSGVNAAGVRSNTFTNHTTSWGVGLRSGLETNWMLGCGFRMYSNGSADLLFTRYNPSIKDRLTTVATNVLANQLDLGQQHVNTVRPHLDLELGFGWGSYFDNNNWHFDLSAGYGFQAFWDQNMFRNFTSGSTAVVQSNMPNGNLYIHGLTVMARLDF